MIEDTPTHQSASEAKPVEIGAPEIGIVAKSRERTEHSRTVCTASTERDRDEARMPRSKP